MREQGKEFPTPATSVGPCPVCGDANPTEFKEFRAFKRVTSDCRAWPAGGRLAACGACGLVFKPFDADFRRESSEIYSSYQIYHQSGGREQRVRDSRTGNLLPRSEVLVDHLLNTSALPASGSILDIGCGNGAFLKAFGAVRPNWKLHGTEHDHKHTDALTQIAGFKELIVGGDAAPLSLARSGRNFDLISMIHVLEHTDDPVAWLRHLLPLLSPQGLLFIQCPNASANPFDLLTADHALHFSRVSLSTTLARAGFDVKIEEGTWITKELSAVARPSVGRSALSEAQTKLETADHHKKTLAQLNWLSDITSQAQILTANGQFGCFGTSIAGTWLAGALEKGLGFFVDEDPDRIGSTYLGRPVCKPKEVGSGSTVLVALAPEAAGEIIRRLSSECPAARWVMPGR
jgi:2-polyprenyl-3-methyl-5-hydroxy-6-metoxy-1,4-benzoquinol methylase